MPGIEFRLIGLGTYRPARAHVPLVVSYVV